MFVLSFSSKRFKKAIIIASAVVVLTLSVVLFSCFTGDAARARDSAQINTVVEGTAGILQFISGYGWEVIPEPDDVREVVIPAEFDDVYKNYNEIQLAQGYDLEEYAGERVKKWSYTVTNYPGHEESDYIKINILVFDGQVIGGDVCSVKLDGFMHGFSVE